MSFKISIRTPDQINKEIIDRQTNNALENSTPNNVFRSFRSHYLFDRDTSNLNLISPPKVELNSTSPYVFTTTHSITSGCVPSLNVSNQSSNFVRNPTNLTNSIVGPAQSHANAQITTLHSTTPAVASKFSDSVMINPSTANQFSLSLTPETNLVPNTSLPNDIYSIKHQEFSLVSKGKNTTNLPSNITDIPAEFLVRNNTAIYSNLVKKDDLNTNDFAPTNVLSQPSSHSLYIRPVKDLVKHGEPSVNLVPANNVQFKVSSQHGGPIKPLLVKNSCQSSGVLVYGEPNTTISLPPEPARQFGQSLQQNQHVPPNFQQVLKPGNVKPAASPKARVLEDITMNNGWRKVLKERQSGKSSGIDTYIFYSRF